jgi:hypothetical protein
MNIVLPLDYKTILRNEPPPVHFSSETDRQGAELVTRIGKVFSMSAVQGLFQNPGTGHAAGIGEV